ncbi:hypothetical protein WJX73_003435 [Symbiochloris irregularis]|uniref:Uncharacterized protein n=1 Tax=Symbiochloris irregularis TaxID=706552 RepID=A0AAW1PIV8_9CHLO
MEEAIPKCAGHNLPCSKFQVKKEGPNKGRWFYKCPMAQGQQCKTFKFITPPVDPQVPATPPHNPHGSPIYDSPGGNAGSPSWKSGGVGGNFGSPTGISSNPRTPQRANATPQYQGAQGNGWGSPTGAAANLNSESPWRTTWGRTHDLTGEASQRSPAQRSGPVVTVSTPQGAPPGWRALSFTYRKAMVDEIKATVPSSLRRYWQEDKTWSVAPEAFAEIIGKLQSAPHNAVIQMGVEDGIAVSQASAGMASQPDASTAAGPRVSVQYTGPDEVAISFLDGYHEAGKEAIRSLPYEQRRWDQDNRVWCVVRDALDEALDRLRAAPVHAQISMPPPMVARMLESDEAPYASQTEARISDAIPQDLWQKLFGFQQEGVRFAVKQGGRVMLADDMGLGKTVQATMMAACFSEDWPLLIICPSTLRLGWHDALKTWLPPNVLPPSNQLVVVSSGKEITTKLQPLFPHTAASKKLIAIISYDLVAKLPSTIAAAFQMIICDESHLLKSPTTERTRCIAPLVKKARRAVLLSGTPLKSQPIELHTQLDMLRPGKFGSRDDFGQRYCGGQKVNVAPGVFEYRGKSNLVELSALLKHTVQLRRLKSEVLDQLPPKTRALKLVALNLKDEQDIKALQAQVDAIQRDSSLTDSARAAQKMPLQTRMYVQLGKAKVKDVVERTVKMVDADKKVLVFGHHKDVLDAIEQKLRANKPNAIAPVRIDGSVSPAQRAAAVDKFQNDEGTRVGLMSIMAAGVGLTLTAAEAVIFAELVWTPADLTQAEDRAHRIGQTKGLTIDYFVAEGTMDGGMWRNLQSKLDTVGRTIDGHAHGTATGLDTTARPGQPSQPARDGVAGARRASGVFADMNSEDDDFDDELAEEAVLASLPSQGGTQPTPPTQPLDQPTQAVKHWY